MKRVTKTLSWGGRQLTLVTCYPFNFAGNAPKRFIVHATLQNSLTP